MNFLIFAVKTTKCVATLILLYFISVFQKTFTRLRLFKPRELEAHQDSDQFNATGYVLFRYCGSISVSPVTVQELTGLIKKRLPVMKYGEFITKGEISMAENGGERCNVCLSDIEEREEVRKLSNCCHVFHRKCLDLWVDEGQVTCPLCRALLFPAKAEQVVFG